MSETVIYCFVSLFVCLFVCLFSSFHLPPSLFLLPPDLSFFFLTFFYPKRGQVEKSVEQHL